MTFLPRQGISHRDNISLAILNVELMHKCDLPTLEHGNSKNESNNNIPRLSPYTKEG